MKTFHGKQSIKDKYIKRLKEHAEADNIIKGQYWEDGKGCAVGCTIEGNDHKKYETELGIPEWLAHLEDKIFERLSNEEAKKFPLELLEAIPIGVSESDMYKLRCDLDFYRLSNLLQKLEPEDFGVEESLREVMRLNFDYTNADDEKWLSARSSAKLAARLAVESLENSAWSAAESAFWSAAKSAVGSPANSAWSAANSSLWSGVNLARSEVWTKEKENLIKGLKKLTGNTKEESVKEMTLEEVCEKLGEEIKIIK